MKSILVLCFILYPLVSFSDQGMRQFTVLLNTNKNSYTISVRAPKDHIALASVVLGGIYHKHMGKVIDATVLETQLSTNDLRAITYFVETDTKRYNLYLNLLDPNYVLTAIQASRHLLSRTTTRQVIYSIDELALKEMPAVKYTIKFKNLNRSVLLNTNDVELGKIALEIAAQMSKHRNDYVGIEGPPMRRVSVTCQSLLNY